MSKMYCEGETHDAWKHESAVAVWAGAECFFEF